MRDDVCPFHAVTVTAAFCDDFLLQERDDWYIQGHCYGLTEALQEYCFRCLISCSIDTVQIREIA